MDALQDALINIGRRKTRSVLAILGIGVACFVLFVTGSMSEYFMSISSHFRKSFQGRLIACEKKSFWTGGGLISEQKVPLIEEIGGVRTVIPILIGRLFNEEVFTIGVPYTLAGMPIDKMALYIDKTIIQEGNLPEKEDEMTAVVGYDLAHLYRLHRGDHFAVRGKDFTIKGVLRKTGALEDRQVFLSLRNAQEVLLRPHLITALIIIPIDENGAAAIPGRIAGKIPWIQVISSVELEHELESTRRYWEILTVLCALLSGISSLLCIAIVMVMAVHERTGEIGLKKALGAENRQIVAELQSEVIVIALAGWSVGIIAAMVFINLFTGAPSTGDVMVFRITGRLIVFSLLWTLTTGALAGLFPALGAASIEPVRAMRKV